MVRGCVSVAVVALVATRAYAAPIPDDEPEPTRTPAVTAPKPVAPPPKPPVKPTPPPRRIPTGPVPWPTSRDEIIPDEPPPQAVPARPSGAGPATRAAPAPTLHRAIAPPLAVVPTRPPVVVPAPPQPRRTTFDLWLDGRLLFDRDGSAGAGLRWLIAGLDHRPTDWVRLYGAVELESGTSFGLEQLHVGLTPNRLFGVRAGLLLLPLGIINLHHRPTSYLTVDRPLTDLLIIPTTWRELGAEIFGELAPGFRYQVQVVSGLDATGFSGPAPLAGGRGNGHSLAIHDPAFVGRLELSIEGLTVGGGGYYGAADSDHPDLYGVRVGVAEGDVAFRGGGWELRGQFAELFIIDSWKVNDYLGLVGQDAVPSRGRGFYGQVGYDVLHFDGPSTQELVLFAGYEDVNPRSRMSTFNYNPPAITGPGELPPSAPSEAKSLLRGGFCYRPWPWLAVKGDIQYALRGSTALPMTPTPLASAPGMPVPLSDDLAAASRARTLVGLSLAMAF